MARSSKAAHECVTARCQNLLSTANYTEFWRGTDTVAMRVDWNRGAAARLTRARQTPMLSFARVSLSKLIEEGPRLVATPSHVSSSDTAVVILATLSQKLPPRRGSCLTAALMTPARPPATR